MTAAPTPKHISVAVKTIFADGDITMVKRHDPYTAILKHISQTGMINAARLKADMFPDLPKQVCEGILQTLCEKDKLYKAADGYMPYADGSGTDFSLPLLDQYVRMQYAQLEVYGETVNVILSVCPINRPNKLSSYDKADWIKFRNPAGILAEKDDDSGQFMSSISIGLMVVYYTPRLEADVDKYRTVTLEIAEHEYHQVIHIPGQVPVVVSRNIPLSA